jgi:hypothetical protein
MWCSLMLVQQGAAHIVALPRAMLHHHEDFFKISKMAILLCHAVPPSRSQVVRVVAKTLADMPPGAKRRRDDSVSVGRWFLNVSNDRITVLVLPVHNLLAAEALLDWVVALTCSDPADLAPLLVIMIDMTFSPQILMSRTPAARGSCGPAGRQAVHQGGVPQLRVDGDPDAAAAAVHVPRRPRPPGRAVHHQLRPRRRQLRAPGWAPVDPLPVHTNTVRPRLQS